jgi:hypothetical protein
MPVTGASRRERPAAERFDMATRIDRWVVRHVVEWMVPERAALAR